jgi:hypothetical protein
MTHRQRQEESRSGLIKRGDFGFSSNGGPIRGKNLSVFKGCHLDYFLI